MRAVLELWKRFPKLLPSKYSYLSIESFFPKVNAIWALDFRLQLNRSLLLLALSFSPVSSVSSVSSVSYLSTS